MKVDYVDHMGSDLSVVNAARVSFDKISEWEIDQENPKVDEQGVYFEKSLKSSDAKLIKYLATHKHWTPFGHTSVSLRIKAPIFVARQMGKHQVGLVWNEVSRRYVDTEPEFYIPEVWRARAEDKKQGSSQEIVFTKDVAGFTDYCEYCKGYYQDLLDSGAAPEMARMVLPQSTYTEWIWTGSVAAFARVCNLRLDPHTQEETREVAKMISDVIEPLFPVSWKELVDV